MTQVTTPQGVRLEYERIGDRHHPTLLLIQGLGAQMICWRRELCEQLAACGLGVIRFDNRDCGLSQKFPDQPYGLADMGDDAIGLLDALGIDRAHVVGQSLGGAIAQEVVLQAPEKVASLCLIYTAPSTSFMLNEREWDDAMAPSPAKTREEAIEQYLQNELWSASPAYEFDTPWIRELGGQIWDRGWYPEGTARQFGAILRSRDHTEALRSVTVPTLIVQGGADRMVDPAAATALAAAIPNSKVKLYPGLGHELNRAIWPELVPMIVENTRQGEAAFAPLGDEHRD